MSTPRKFVHLAVAMCGKFDPMYIAAIADDGTAWEWSHGEWIPMPALPPIEEGE